MCTRWHHASEEVALNKEQGNLGNVFERSERRVRGEGEEGVRSEMEMDFDVMKVEVVRERMSGLVARRVCDDGGENGGGRLL